MTEKQSAVRIWRDRVAVNLPNGAGPDPETLLRSYAQRIMALPEVTQVRLGSDRLGADVDTLEIRFKTELDSHGEFLKRLSKASGGQGEKLPETRLPLRTEKNPLAIYRHGSTLSSWKLIRHYNGRAKFYHPQLAGNSTLAAQVEANLRSSQSGIYEINANPAAGHLRIAYDVKTTNLDSLVRVLEAPLSNAGVEFPMVIADPIRFTTVNTSLGLATIGAFAFSPATPLCAGLIIASNLVTVRDAATQLSRGKLGTPIWMTALLACSVASGQVLAFAVTDWCWHYWERRWRKDVSSHSQRLLQSVLPIPREINFTTPEGIEVSRPVALINPGQTLSMESGEVLPVDGRIKSGVALVNERAITGISGLVRKERGDHIYAGSHIYHGKLDISVQARGSETRAAHVAGTVVETSHKLQRAPGVHRKAVKLSDRTVPPILAAAGVGLATGSLFVVGAILHQDWYSDAHTAAPLTTLEDIGQALKQGLVVRDPDLLGHIEKTGFVVLQDQPALHACGLKLSSMETSQTDHALLLRTVAGAALYLGDARTAALLTTCMSQQLTVKQPELLDLEKDSVTVKTANRNVTLRNLRHPGSKPPSLAVEIDGHNIATLHFDTEPRPLTAGVVQELRALGLQVFLVSENSEAQAAQLAQQLGVDGHSGELDPQQTVHFLKGLQRRGVKALYIGHGPQTADILEVTHASISLIDDPAQLKDDASSGSLLGTELIPLIELFRLARDSGQRLKKTFRSGMVFNLLCVAGGFGGVLNGLTSGILGNLSVIKVRQQALRNLEQKFPNPL
jgi:cation transport ATPase